MFLTATAKRVKENQTTRKKGAARLLTEKNGKYCNLGILGSLELNKQNSCNN